MAVKNPFKTVREKNLVETVTEVASGVKKASADELSREWRIAMAQMLGIQEKVSGNSAKTAGDLHEGEEISFTRTEKPPRAEAAMDYSSDIIHAETIVRREEQGELGKRILEIRTELIQVAGASDNQGVRNITVESQTQNAGVYHAVHMEGLLSRIKAKARGASEIVHQKVAKRDYWSLAKSKGTSFSLSAERVVAQQVG